MHKSDITSQNKNYTKKHNHMSGYVTGHSERLVGVAFKKVVGYQSEEGTETLLG